jgi:hypothetical protein
MSNKPYDSSGVHERVSLGDVAPASRRRSGVTLARPGHFSATGHATASAVQSESSAKTGRRAVRAKIKPIQSGGKD